MAKIYTTRNNGKGSRKVGEIVVNSKNVSPNAITAVATTGAVIPKDEVENYEFFNVTSGGAARRVYLPGGLPVGTEIDFYVGANGFRVVPTVDSAELLNGGAGDTNHVPIAANCRAICFKDTPTHWTVNQLVAAGTITAPTAA